MFKGECGLMEARRGEASRGEAKERKERTAGASEGQCQVNCQIERTSELESVSGVPRLGPRA